MKTSPAHCFCRRGFLLACGIALSFLSFARAATSDVVAAVRAADDERVAAMAAADRGRLDAIYSDELHYAHSSGKVDTKASFVGGLASRAMIYHKVDYKTREFQPIAPGVVLMTGRALIDVGNANGKQQLDLGFLAVWREEHGKWRFVAWQSCKMPADDGAKK